MYDAFRPVCAYGIEKPNRNECVALSFQPSYPSITSYPKCVTNFPRSSRRPLPTGAIQLTNACWRSTSCPWSRPYDDETRGIEEPATKSTRNPASPGLLTAFWKTISATSTLNVLSSKSKTRSWFVPVSGRLKLYE